MMNILRDDDGKRYIQCECGCVSKAIGWSIGDDILHNILKAFAKCPECRSAEDKAAIEEPWRVVKTKKKGNASA